MKYVNGGRFVSLDVLRGLTVVGMIVVNSMSALKYGENVSAFPSLLHAPWDGITIADLVFPAFLMMVGVAIPLALSVNPQSNSAPSTIPTRSRSADIFARSIRLFLLGLLLSNLYWMIDFDARDWRLFGVLQRIGMVYCACALLYLTASPRIRLAIIAATLLLYWPIVLIPSPDGLPTDIWQRGHNFAAYVDRALLGAGNHIFVTGPTGYDPEGLLGTFPAMAHGLIGVAIGEYLCTHPRRSVRVLAVVGFAMLAIGALWSMTFPAIKDIWSSSFVLITCGLTTLALAALHWWLDNAEQQSAVAGIVTAFGTAFGTNAVAAYALHQLSGEMPAWDILMSSFHWLRPHVSDGWASFLPVLIYTAIIWLCVDYLRRKRWIIKI